ncbi:sulfhydryl oxidase-like protein [Sarcoptes scabiei]|uniref:Sulfhydryl oxidase n=1 Tax=Sarcoptes scabiei TaxID=52283 RepID=A0A132AB22_SARSC|nr:sulfhydryl oxidase-like protein [Sarcoptes scabiei]
MVILLFNYRFLINSFIILLRTKFFIQFLIDTIESVNLYDNRSNVITLIDNNFFSNILNKDYLIVCNYYKHWSPECQRFSYLFRNFSEITRPWNQALRLISVNCAENLVCNRALKNSDVLDDVEASNFPIIQFIEPKTKEITEDIGEFEFFTIDDLQSFTIQKIVSNEFLRQKFSLQPISNIETINDVCKILNDENGLERDGDQPQQYAIIEPFGSYFGALLILDLLPYRNMIEIKRFISNQNLLNSLFSNRIQLPIIVEILSSCNYRIIGNVNNERTLRYEFVALIRARFRDRIPSNDDILQKNQKLIDRNQNEIVSSVVNHYNLSFVDLHNTLRYTLIYEVSSRNVLNAKQLAVLKRFFQVILAFFPFDNENVKRLFKRMTGWFDHRKSNHSLSVAKYLAALKTSDGFLKPMESWRHCNGTRPIHRGYPCGVWVLFHSMLANEYNMTKNDPNAKPKVLPLMRSYIEAFFTCYQCRRYFLEASSNLDEQLIYPNSSVLWLWLNQPLKIHHYPQSIKDYYF